MSLKDLWSKLFGKGSTPTDTRVRAPLAASPPKRRESRERDSTLLKRTLSVESLNFVGQASQSPNKRWVVGCTDRLPGMNARQEHRDGSVVLLDYQADLVVLRVADLYRPIDSAVSNTGAFVLCDGNFGNRLGSGVLAFDALQKKVLSRSFSANVFNMAISECGRYVVVQTANAPSGDGNVLELLDLQIGKVLFSRRPQTGWADEYAFVLGDDGELKKLAVVRKDLGRFNYSPSGDFLDQAAYRKARLFKGSPEMRISSAKHEQKADPTNRALAEELLVSLDAALQELDHSRLDFLAMGLRTKGEALELLGRTSEAVSAYEGALSANPKVGVAARASRLKKKLEVG